MGKTTTALPGKQITMPWLLKYSSKMPSHWQERQTEWLQSIDKTAQLEFILTVGKVMSLHTEMVQGPGANE